jgi:hypothetical protein
MDKDQDARLTFDEFVEGSKQDPTIVQVSHTVLVRSDLESHSLFRRYRYMMVWLSKDRPFLILLKALRIYRLRNELYYIPFKLCMQEAIQINHV